MKWSTFLIIGVSLLVVIIGWRGTQDSVWQSLGGTVNNKVKKPVNLFPNIPATYSPMSIPSIPQILSTPTTIPNEPFSIISGALSPGNINSGAGNNRREDLASILAGIHGA